MKQQSMITLRLPPEMLDNIARCMGPKFPTRSAFIRAAIQLLLLKAVKR